MSTSIKGTIVVYKRDGTVAWTGQATATRHLVSQVSLRKDANVQKLVIGGKTLTIAADEPTETITITATPAAGAGVGENILANAEAACESPDPLAIITLAGFPDGIDGTYNFLNGEITFPDGIVTHTMTAERYNGAALS